MTTIRVLLADDDAVVRSALAEILNQDERIQVISLASNGHEAVQQAREAKPDVVVLDWFMPLLNGFDAARALTAPDRVPLAILITAFHQDSYLEQALQAGIRGYLPKECAVAELAGAIREVVGGEVYVSPRLSTVVAEAMKSGRARVRGIGRLTIREREVLQLVAEGRGSKEIATLLGVSSSTIARHRERIAQKLDIHDVAGLIRYAIQVGMVLPHGRSDS